ncbi:MAG: hypothetical protein EOO70_00135 [Myxococcaceae bacterium]|nr:MAG: hypothetical protein EOO70_00135 [Myxococcaceae bacterium]
MSEHFGAITHNEESNLDKIPKWLDQIFNDLNNKHFGGSLQRPDFSVSSMGGHFAFYAPVVRMIFFHPRTLDQTREFITDTLLHELVHYALEVRTGDHSQDHGPAFVQLANEIGAALRLPAVQQGTDAVITWPQSVRPKDYAPWRLASVGEQA